MTMIINIFLQFICRHKFVVTASVFCCALLLAETAFCGDDYLTYCSSETIDEEYEKAGCWSCEIIENLMISLTTIAGTLYGTTVEAAKLILTLGSAIWIALYFLKSLGSFATQDPAKIIDGLLTFCFKVALVYALVTAGIDVLVQYIVNPLLSIGFDIGETFAGAVSF